MGTFNSRTTRMDDMGEASLIMNDGDADIAQLLQYLIRSGQVHIIASDQDQSDSDSDVELHPPITAPRNLTKPDTEILEKSAFTAMVRSATGAVKKTGHERPASIARLLSARERGLPGSGALTQGDLCRIMTNILPNKREHVATHRSKIFCCTMSRDGNTLLTASQDKKLRLYDTRHNAYRLSKVISGRNVGWSILDAAFSPDEQFIAYSSWSECVHLCSVNDDSDNQESLLLMPSDRRFCIFSLTFSSDGNEILCGSNDGCIYIYDRQANKRNLRIPSHDDDVNTVAFADSSSQIVYSGGDDGIVKVWDRRTLNEAEPQPAGMLAGHLDGITYIEPRGDGRHLLSNSKDQSIKLWDVRCFSSDDALQHAKKAVDDQSWDYRWQGIPKTLRNARKVPGDSSLMTYCGHAVLQTLCRCHFSPMHTTGQRYIYAGCASGRVVVYDALTGAVAKAYMGHKGCVRDVAWHPYRPEIVSASWDGHIYKWTYSEDMDCDCAKPVVGSGVPVRRSQRIKDRMSRLGVKLSDDTPLDT